MAMWHPSNFFNIQSSIDSLSDKFTQLQSNHQTLLLKCQQDCSKAVSQGISSDSSFQVLMNNEKDVINSGLQHLSALGKQYNKETLNLKDLIAQDYNNVKPSSSANLKNQTNPVDSLRSFVESNFESIKAKIFFLDGIEKLDATAMKHLEEHFDGAQKSVSAAFSNFCNIQKKALAKKSHIDISQIEHYCSVNFLTIDSLNSNLGSLAKDIVNYSSEFNSLLVSYKKESHILQEGLNHVKQQIYTMTKEGQDNKPAGGRPSTSMKHERPPKGSNIQKELLALDQLVAQAIAANIYKNTAFNALKETIETQQVQLAKRVDDFAVEIGMIKEANGAIVETISQSQKLRTPNRTKASHKSREGTPEGGGKKKSLSPGLKSYINKMSPFDNTQKLQRFSPPARKKSPQTQPCSARIRNASEEKLTQNSELLSQTALFNETSKTALTKYGKDIDKLRKELKRNKKQYEDYVVSLNDKAKKIEGCIRKLLVSAGKIGAASSKKTDEDIFLFKAFQHDYKLLEDKLNKLFVCKESSPLKETANTRSMSQDVSRYRSRHLDLSGNRTATKDDEKKSKKALIASHGKGDKKLSDMLDEFEKKQSLLLSTLEADKEPLSSDRYLKSEEKVKDRRHENKTFKSEADQFRREFSRDRKSSEQNRKERERSRLESSSLFEDEKERKAHKEALINEKKMKQVMEENEIVKREISDLKEKTKRIQNKAEERKKTLKQLFDLVVEKDKELNNYKEALRRNDHQVKRNRDEIENKIEEHMTLFIAAFEELDKQLTGKETKLNNIEEILGEVLKSRTEKSSLKIENASGQKVKLKSLEKRRKKLEELINVIDMSIVNKSSKELEYVKEFLSQEKDDLAAGTGLRQDVVAYQVDEDVKFSKNPKFNETIKLQDLKTKIEKGDLNLLDAKVGGRSKRPKALELDEFDAKQAYKLGREEPKENRSMASEHMKTGNNSIVTEEHEAITKKIDQLFDGLRGDVESYRMSGNKRQENVQRSETNTEKEISDKDTSSEGGMVGRIAAIGMPPRPDGGESAKKASIQEIESAFHSVKVLKDEIEILKAEKAQEEKLFKDENRSLKNLVDFVNQRVDLIYEWLKDGTDYKNWAVSDKVRNLRDILQQREEDKTEELENAKAQLEELLIQERQKFKAKKASAEQKAHEREEQIKLKVISLETSNAELQSAIEACKKEILAKAQENKQMTQEIESKDNQIKSLEEHLLQAKSSEQDQQKFDAVLTSLDDHLSSLINKHAGSQVQNETEDNEVAVQDRIRRRITQIEFCLQQKHQESELLRRENSETKKQADKLKRDKEELEKLIKHKENAVFATLNQYEKLEDEANNLVEANSKLEAALRKTEQDLQKRKVEVSNSSEEVEKLKQALERANDNNNSLEKRIKEENSEIQKARLVTEEEKNKNEQEIKTLIKEKILLEEEKRSLEQVLQEVKKKLSVVNGDLETIKQQEAGLKNILTEQEKVVNEKIKALTETEKMCTNLTGALDSLQVQYNELNEVNKELESYIEELRAQIDRLTHQKEEMRIEKERMNEESSSTIDQVTRKMAEYQQTVRLLEEKLRVSLVQKEELVKEIEGGNTDVLNAKELLNNKEQELQKLSKEKESFEKERIEKEKQLLTVKEEIESIKVIFNKREKEIKKLLETNSTLERDAKTLNETKKDLENQKSGLEEKLRLAQADLETIKREHGDIQEQVKISSNKIKELTQELERERNNFKTGDQNLREAIQQKNKQIEEVSATNDQLTSSLAFLNRDKDELVNRVHNLEENIRQYEDKNQALKKACELQEHTVANLKENLQKETEKAAQTSREAGEKIKALGDEMNDLKKTKQELISSVKSFEAEVGELERLLKEEKQTQCDMLKTKQEHIAKLEGEIQNLSEENDRKHKELKVSQESIITLNTNVDSLKEEVNKLQKENSDVKQNLLQKEKAMSDIEQILKSEIQKQVNDIKDKESLIAQLRSEIEEVRREIRDKDEKIVELRETIQKETNVIAKENDDLQESVRTKERQIEDLTKQKETLQNQINLLESQAAENQANHEKQIQSWRQKQEIINQEIVAKEKEYGLLQEKLNEAERSYNEVNTQRIDLGNQVQGLEQEVHRLSEELRGHENQNTESQRENKRIEFELNEANRRVRELESRIELFVKEKEELASQLSVSQSQITQSENMLNESNAQLQVSLNEKEGKIKGLEEQYTKAMKILESQQHRLASEEEKCHALEESISIKEGELEELRKQNQIISEQLHVEENKLRESREAGNKESDTLVNENAELREENKRKDEQIHAIQTENDELKENMQKMLADTEHNKASSEKEIENLKGSLVKLEEKNTNIEDEFLSLTNENENLTMANNNRVSKLTEMEQLLKSKEATYKINLENIQKEVVILTEQILAFKSQADENNQLKTENENLKAQVNEISSLKNEVNTLKERLKFEKENLDQLAEENRQLSSRVRQTGSDSIEGARALKEQINQLNQGILSQNEQIETLQREKEEIAKELNLFKIETEIKEREKDAEIQALKDELNDQDSEEGIEFADLKNDFAAKEKDWQAQREAFKNELAKITTKNQESFRNPFEAEKPESNSSKPSSFVEKPEENVEKIAELEEKLAQMEKALKELDEENKSLRLASPQIQATNEGRGFDVKQEDNKEISFSVPNEADDLKARIFLEEQDSFAEKNREKNLSNGADIEEYVRSLHEKNRKLQDENDELQQQNRLLKRENDMAKVFDQDFKSELREKDEEMDRMQFQMTLLKEELSKADKQKASMTIQPAAEPASVNIAHEKEHIRTIFCKFMNVLLQGNAKDSEELLKLLLSLLELNETSKNQVLTSFKAKAQKKGMLGKLF